MSREPKTNKLVEEVKEWYNDLDGGGKFVFWWLSFIVVAVICAIIFFSIVWTPWVGGTALIVIAAVITIGCFIYLEENY